MTGEGAAVRAEAAIDAALRLSAALRSARSARELVLALRASGFSQATIACAAATSTRSVRAWEHGGAIRLANAARVRQVSDIVLLLLATLTPAGVEEWLVAARPDLNGKAPAKVLAEGGLAEVHSAATDFVEGTYV